MEEAGSLRESLIEGSPAFINRPTRLALNRAGGSSCDEGDKRVCVAPTQQSERGIPKRFSETYQVIVTWVAKFGGIIMRSLQGMKARAKLILGFSLACGVIGFAAVFVSIVNASINNTIAAMIILSIAAVILCGIIAVTIDLFRNQKCAKLYG